MKTHRRVAVALLLALTPCAYAAPTFAQAGAEDPITAMARARFKEGVDFYDKGQYDQARASFLQAYALKKHPAVLLNLAWSCLKSGHAMEGKKYFEQFLSDSKEITDKQRADANDGLSQAKAKLGRIEVQATSGTDVTVDGDHVGTAPLSDAVTVEAGAHTVKFKGSDGSTDTQSISVLGGQKAVAKFPQSGSAPTPTPEPTPAPAPAPSNDTSNTPAPAPAPADTSSHPERVGKDSKSSDTLPHGSIFTPPDNMVPVFIFAGVSLAGFATGIVMGISKTTAQNNANDLASKINANGGPAANPGATNAYNSDLNDVNTDATIANIGLGVGAAGLLGAVIYWVAANKTSETSMTGLIQHPVVVPTVGRSSGGAAFSFSF